MYNLKAIFNVLNWPNKEIYAAYPLSNEFGSSSIEQETFKLLAVFRESNYHRALKYFTTKLERLRPFTKTSKRVVRYFTDDMGPGLAVYQCYVQPEEEQR